MKNFGVAGGKEQTRVKCSWVKCDFSPFFFAFIWDSETLLLRYLGLNIIRQIIIINYADKFFFWGKFNYFTRKLSTSIK